MFPQARTYATDQRDKGARAALSTNYFPKGLNWRDERNRFSSERSECRFRIRHTNSPSRCCTIRSLSLETKGIEYEDAT
jgi:hypothetical protein